MKASTITGLVESATKKWTKQRKAEERHARARTNRAYTMRSQHITIKAAAERFMEEAYLKASSGGTLPAHARQVMYAARGLIQNVTGAALNDQYFCQTLLPDYMDENPETASWDIVFDSRGHLTEPHTETVVALGTLGVRKYLHDIGEPTIEGTKIRKPRLETNGPSCRYGGILFVEKEGFMPLFEKVQLADRFDISIMSTKGMSNTASRSLVDKICDDDVPLFVLHDFDKSGFSIVGTLQRDTRRYQFANSIEVIDLGIRMADVAKYNLTPEAVSYGRTSDWSIRNNLRKNGASEDEIAFLLTQRVELNAFSSGDLVQWIEDKLRERGVEKVIPEDDLLKDVYRSAVEYRHLKKASEKLLKNAAKAAEKAKPPGDLKDRITERLETYPAESWDEALYAIAEGDAQ